MSNTFTNNIANFSRFLCLLISRGDWRKRKPNLFHYRGLSVKPWSHVRILRYLTWVIGNLLDYEQDLWKPPKAMGLLLAIEIIKICFVFLFRFLFHQTDVRKIWQFIIRLWLRNVYSELYSQANIINSNKNLKSRFEIRLYIFCCLFLLIFWCHWLVWL